jgi:hypothetical protein
LTFFLSCGRIAELPNERAANLVANETWDVAGRVKRLTNRAVGIVAFFLGLEKKYPE